MSELEKNMAVLGPSALSQSRRYSGVNVGRFVLAITVVFGHTCALFIEDCIPLIESWDWLFNLVNPFFFMTAGVLTMRHIAGQNDEKVRSAYILGKSKRYFRIWGLLLLAYLPMSVAFYILGKGMAPADVPVTIARELITTGMISPAWMAWYLLSSAMAFLTIWLFHRRGRLWTGMTLVALVALGASMAFRTKEPGFVGALTYGIATYILPGMYYVFIGMLLERYRPRRRHTVVTVGLSAVWLALLMLWAAPTHAVVPALVEVIGPGCLTASGFVGGAALSLLTTLPPGRRSKKICGTKAAYNLGELSIWLFYSHMYPLTVIRYTVGDALYQIRGMVSVVPVMVVAALVTALLMMWIARRR